MLRTRNADGRLAPTLTMVKTRGSDHDRGTHPSASPRGACASGGGATEPIRGRSRATAEAKGEEAQVSSPKYSPSPPTWSRAGRPCEARPDVVARSSGSSMPIGGWRTCTRSPSSSRASRVSSKPSNRALGLAANTLPLRSAILIESEDAEPQMIVWRSERQQPRANASRQGAPAEGVWLPRWRAPDRSPARSPSGRG